MSFFDDDVLTRRRRIRKKPSRILHRNRTSRPRRTIRRIRVASVHSVLVVSRFLLLLMVVVVVVVTVLLPSPLYAQQQQQALPNLHGRHFKITVLQENGFLDILEDPDTDDDDNEEERVNSGKDDESVSTNHNNKNKNNNRRSYHDNLRHVRYQGYLIDMLYAVAEKANFTFTLLPPSGMGSACVPRIYTTTTMFNDDDDDDETNNGANTSSLLYDKIYRTQYNCGASDVNDYTIFGTNTTTTTTTTTTTNNITNINTTMTDMYLGMYYVSPARQLVNHFTIPFVPPFSGTLAMFGTATNIANFTSLFLQQQQQKQKLYSNLSAPSSAPTNTVGVQVTAETTCCPAGTALIQAIQEAYPGLTVRGIYATTQDEIFQHFYNGSCTVYINDGPIAAQFVLRQSQKQQQQPNPCTDQYGNVRNDDRE
jgi:ABC-type amino acid transport substrate-binding protein